MAISDCLLGLFIIHHNSQKRHKEKHQTELYNLKHRLKTFKRKRIIRFIYIHNGEMFAYFFLLEQNSLYVFFVLRNFMKCFFLKKELLVDVITCLSEVDKQTQDRNAHNIFFFKSSQA